MAEHVHQNLEGMLPELEEMEKLNVFSRKEIRSIIKIRTDFEYRLQKRAPEKQDFLRYIQYEINLDALRKKRKLNLGLKKAMKGEYEVTRRLHRLFKKALQKFKHDTKLWLQYIEYCKKAGSTKSLGKVFGQLLQYHPHNPTFWVMAAKCEFEESKNIPAARALLQRGLRMNSESKLLWLEYFRMELLHVDKVIKRRAILGLAGMKQDEEEEVTDAFLAGKAAEIAFRKAIEEIPNDINFRLSFLKIYRLFDNTKTGQDFVFESLKKDFHKHEEYWKALASRPLDDLLAKNDRKLLQDNQIADAEKERDNIFNQAVEELPTEKMWDFYINANTEGLEEKTSRDIDKVVEKCLEICTRAHKKHLLSTQSFMIWIQLLLMVGDTSKALSILREQISKNNTPEIYVEYLRLLIIQEKKQETITKEFWNALAITECSESVELWQLFLDWSITNNANNVALIFENSLRSCDIVIEVMRDRYIDWLVTTAGISKARQVYRRFYTEKLVSLSFLRKCVALELAQLSPIAHQVRQLYDIILDQYGTNNSDCWLEYIHFELTHPAGRIENAGHLHWRAIKILSGVDLEDFVAKYSLLQAGRLHAADANIS